MSFDQCAVRRPGGGFNLLSRHDFTRLPLAERIKIVMAGQVQFLRDGQPISVRDALDDQPPDPAG